MVLGPEDVSLLERCPLFRGCHVHASAKLGPEDVPLLERCPLFRVCHVHASAKLGPEDIERCPYFRGCMFTPLQDGMTALMHAAYRGSVEACQKLLEHRADVNWNGHKDGVWHLQQVVDYFWNSV